MRGIQIPAAAPRFAIALLATTIVLGCGAASRPAKAAPATGSAVEKASEAALTASTAPATGSGAAGARLTAIAFVSRADGSGMFTRQAGGRCQILAGRTTDGGASFGTLASVTTWPCSQNPPASFLAADSHGDAFLYDPKLFVSHDGGRTWAPGHEPGIVLAVATAGRTTWMVRAGCPPHGRACELRVLESANGGRTWAAAPAQPTGATVREVGGQPGQEGALGQTWLMPIGRSSAYMLTSPADHAAAPMWFTTDGGASWARREVRCGMRALSVTLSAAPGGTLAAVCAGEPSAGFQAKSAARSADGGRTWAVHPTCLPGGCQHVTPLDNGYLGQIDAVSAKTVFLVGARSWLLVTTDGGAHWRVVRPLIGDSGGGTFGVVFVNPRDGFVLGDGPRNNERPTIWRTFDGGAHWSRVIPGAG
jgi:photosystem II stability/assembly factor-like uncharacterized protein